MAKRTASGRTRVPVLRPAIGSGSSSFSEEEESDEEFTVGSAPSTSTQGQVKPCSKCKEVKPLDQFWQDPTKKSGRTSWCKGCFSACAEARKKAGHVKVDDKVCSICKQRKPADAFMKDSRRLTGLDARCRECRKRQHHEKKLKNIEAGNLTWPEKECKRCHVVKPAKDFKRHAYTKSGLDSWCKDCCRERRQEQQRAKQQQQPEGPTPTIKTCTTCIQVKETAEFARDRSQADGFCRRCKDCEKVYRQSKRVCPSPPLSPAPSQPTTPLELSAPASPTFMMRGSGGGGGAAAWAGVAQLPTLQQTHGIGLPLQDLSILLQQHQQQGVLGPAITTGATGPQQRQSPFARAPSPPVMGLPPANAAAARTLPGGPVAISDASLAQALGLTITDLSTPALTLLEPLSGNQQQGGSASGTAPPAGQPQQQPQQSQQQQLPWAGLHHELSLSTHDWATTDNSLGLNGALPDTSLSLLLKSPLGEPPNLQLDTGRQVVTQTLPLPYPTLRPTSQPSGPSITTSAGNSLAAESQPSWFKPAAALLGSGQAGVADTPGVCVPEQQQGQGGQGGTGRGTLADQISRLLPVPDEKLLDALDVTTMTAFRADSLLGDSLTPGSTLPLPIPSFRAVRAMQQLGPSDAAQPAAAAGAAGGGGTQQQQQVGPMVRDDSLIGSFLGLAADQLPAGAAGGGGDGTSGGGGGGVGEQSQQLQQVKVEAVPVGETGLSPRTSTEARAAAQQLLAPRPRPPGRSAFAAADAGAAAGLSAALTASAGGAADAQPGQQAGGAAPAPSGGAAASESYPSFMAAGTWCFSAASDLGLAPLPAPVMLDTEMERLGSLSLRAGAGLTDAFPTNIQS